MRVVVAVLLLGGSALATHALLLRWMADQGVVEALLSTGTDAPVARLMGAASFVVLRVAVLLCLPGLVAGSGVWAVTGLVARRRQGR